MAQAAASGMQPYSLVSQAKAADPTKALRPGAGALWLGADVFAGIGSAMGLAGRVPAGNEGNRFLLVRLGGKARVPPWTR